MATTQNSILAERLIRIVRRMGYDYTDRREPGLEDVAHPPLAARRCVHVGCGGFNPRHARYCAHCGRPLRADVAARLVVRRMRQRRREALAELRRLPRQLMTELPQVPNLVAQQAKAWWEQILATLVLLAVIVMYVALTWRGT